MLKYVTWVYRACGLCGFKTYKQGNYCNNLATRVIPFFVVSKLSVGEIILKTVPTHFSNDPVA